MNENALSPAGMPSRTHHSARNALVGTLCQILTILMAFVVRLFFVRALSVDYQGISGWFSNILSILGISELGIGTALVVSLYKPLAQGDTPRIRATLRLLHRAYRYVGLVVLGLGLLLLPFLPVLINKQTDLVDLRIVYLMFLAQSVFSYWFWGYKSAVYTADQRQSRIHVISLIVSLCSSTLQILVLVLWHNYYAYVALYAPAVLLKNLLTAASANRDYPYLKRLSHLLPEEDDQVSLPRSDRKSIFKNLFGLSLYRLSGTMLTATDSLVLGKFIGFTILGIYSNYLFVITAVTTIFSLIFQSFTASVGNLHVTGDLPHRRFIFRSINLLDGWLYGFGAVCLYVLLDPFVALFFGADRVFADPSVVLIIAMNFLTSGLLENTIMHKDACGLFWQGRFRPVFSAGLNILLSLWWVHSWGISGVLAATIVSRLLTTWWFDPWMVHHYALQTGVKGYFGQTCLILLLSTLCGGTLKALQGWLFPAFTLGGLTAMLLLCLTVPNALFWCVFHGKPEYTYLREKALGLWQSWRKHVGGIHDSQHRI
ncbi:MAG: oligosaccharide flippase family protein [Clostridiales bacterium]|nr:oligosaccharide flippase family protein [Clostridiales bacterium]